MFTWSAVEVSIGIVIAGLIELGPLAAKYGIKGFESYAELDDQEVPMKNMTGFGTSEYEMDSRKI